MEDDGQIARYLLGIPEKAELASYAKQFLGDDQRVVNFVDELWQRTHAQESSGTNQPKLVALKKQEQSMFPSKNTPSNPPVPSRPATSSSSSSSTSSTSVSTSSSASTTTASTSSSSSTGKRSELYEDAATSDKRSKDKSFAMGRGVKVTYVKDPNKVRNREECSCQATQHPLVCNCTACGKIVCELEGEGECFFCGSFVTKTGTQIAPEFLKVMSGKGEEEDVDIKEYYDQTHNEAGLSKAVAHKNKLLGFAKEQAHRTAIHDEQADYYDFQSNVWMNEEEKKRAKALAEDMERQLQQRKMHKISIDIENKRVITSREDDFDNIPLQPETKVAGSFNSGMMNHSRATVPSSSGTVGEYKQQATDTRYFANDTLKGRAREVYDGLKDAIRQSRENAAMAKQQGKTHEPRSRVQHDDPYAEEVVVLHVEPEEATEADGPSCEAPAETTVDRGMCLSMHQPWASLLVAGIKRFEGRGWSTKHRGPLWIASTARDAEEAEIQSLQAEYRAVYGEAAEIPFPKSYPKGALLGCVDMVDCWTQEQFQQYRKGKAFVEDSESAFVFVCQNPRQLKIVRAISGQHKLWNLDPTILATAKEGLKPVSMKWDPAVEAQKKPPMDIWPTGYRGGGVPAALAEQAFKPVVKEIIPGLVHLKNFLSLSQQQNLVDACRDYGVSEGGFYVPTYENSNHLNLYMFCLGQNWNLVTSSYEPVRTNHDNAPVPPVPPSLLQPALACLKESQKVSQVIPDCKPDICIVNFYTAAGKLGMHQDKDETKRSLAAGIPVISLSLGDACDFVFGDKDNPQSVRLQSGDGLVFGGPARNVFHGVAKVHPNTCPRNLKLKSPGRVNLTFRQYDV